MNSITFDTLAYSRKLQAAGVAAEQADAMAEAQKEAFDQMVDTRDRATKRDLAEMEARLTKATYNAMFGMAGVVIAVAVVGVAILK